jgi:hypothetical protein
VKFGRVEIGDPDLDPTIRDFRIVADRDAQAVPVAYVNDRAGEGRATV